MLSVTVFPLLFASLSVVSGSNLIQSRQSVTPPPECDVIPTWEVTNFLWFNSSDNLDCANPVNVRKCEALSPKDLGIELVINDLPLLQQLSALIQHRMGSSAAMEILGYVMSVESMVVTLAYHSSRRATDPQTASNSL